jgi:hypothetical protein
MEEFFGTMAECHEWFKAKGLTRDADDPKLGWFAPDIGLGVIQYVGIWDRPDPKKEYCAKII